MKYESSLSILLLLISPLIFIAIAGASTCDIIIVEPGQSIQQAINMATEGQTIYLKRGVYQIGLGQPIIVNKTLTLIGEDAKETILDGSEKATLILSILASKVTIKNLTIMRSAPANGIGVHIKDSSNVKITNCYILDCHDGIWITNSTYNEISRNYIKNNTNRGLFLHSQSSYNTIFWNIIENNSVGVFLELKCEDNIFYQNNFVENGYQVAGFGIPNNYWNKAYPAGGNYWSNYSGEDLKSGSFQDEEGSDGIGDTPHSLSLEAKDQYPLFGFIHCLLAYRLENVSYHVLVSTNISEQVEVYSIPENETIQIMMTNVRKGFVRVAIPKALAYAEDESWIVSANGVEIPYRIMSDETYTYIYVQINAEIESIRIKGTCFIPEFSCSYVFTAIFLITLLALVTFKVRRINHKKCETLKDESYNDYNKGSYLNMKFITVMLMFLLIFTILPLVNSQFTLDITVQTDKDSYLKREKVNITGNVTYQGVPVEDGLVGVQIESPLRTILLRSLNLNESQTPQSTIEIVTVYPADEYGNPKWSTERGKYLWFKMTIKNNGLTTRTVYVSILVTDAHLIPLDMDMAAINVPAGETVNFMPRMYIPWWATVGKALIYSNVYDGWPKDGGRPLCPEKSSNFDIIESIYSDPSPSPITESASTENGTYNVTFRLPPDVVPGTYEVSISAWSPSAGGYEGFTSTSFDVVYVPSPPWPSFVIKPPIAGPNYTITFDASPSSAEGYNDTITNYFWNFGDGKTAEGRIVTHSYISEGNYTVTLNVTDNEGFWNVTHREISILIIHNIAIVNLECLNVIYNDWLVYIKVEIKNFGTYPETFNVSLSANGSLIGGSLVSDLGPQEIITVMYTWNTTGLELLANYILQVYVDPVQNETDLTDNSANYGPIFVKMLGDIIFNRKIDLFDAVALLRIYGVKEGDPNWDVMVDLIRDGAINLFDAVKLLSKYGFTY